MNKYKILLWIIAFCFFQRAKAQTDLSYLNGEETVQLNFDTQYGLLSLSENPDQNELQSKLPQGVLLVEVIKDEMPNTLNPEEPSNIDRYHAYVQFPINTNIQTYLYQLDVMSHITNVLDVSPFYIWNAKSYRASSYFYVKLYHESDFELLEQQANQSNVNILGNSVYAPLWYVLQTNKDSEFALDVSNDLKGTDYFESVYTDLGPTESQAATTNSTPVSDPRFAEQWGHNNTGQTIGTSTGVAGIDVNANKAWEITKGNPDITIAVFDAVGSSHADLPPQLPILLTESNTNSLSIHGLQVTGVIAATHNNIGIAGLAPDCPIQPIYSKLEINHPFGGNTTTELSLASGFYMAYGAGADVINCSWNWEVPPVGSPTLIISAIDHVLTYGRNGKGMIVVFCSQNTDGAIPYPANSALVEDILVVGAINNQGSRWHIPANPPQNSNPKGSNYGPSLDVVAPGSNVLTLGGHSSGYGYASGTSLAAPYVSAIAALILSENPCLSVKAVNSIIEETSRKIGGYSYSTTALRPNGNWNNEMGYGLVDAYAAVRKAQTLYLQNIEEANAAGHMQHPHSHRAVRIEAGKNIHPNQALAQGNYDVTNGNARVTLEAKAEIILKDGFVAKATDINGNPTGTFFTAKINSQIANCDDPTLPWFVRKANPLNQHHSVTDELKNEGEMLLVYPNPTTLKSKVELTLLEDQKINLQLFHYSGKLINNLAINKHAKKGKNYYNLNVEGFTSGIYLLRVTTKDQTVTKKIIVN